ncbi:restriction endonuclease subunit S [Vibrio alginolyticus]|uniref:restriction endonuclease subunit S n=1 Tax=Vibrio alginolyticus TaxID=663 RepID=UPI00354C7292
MSKEYNKALIPERRFPDFMTDESWKIMSFGEAFSRITTKNAENNTNVLTISAQHGLVSQTEYFKKSVAAKDLTGYYLLQKGDFAYNKSYSKGYPMGAIKPLKLYEQGVVSTLYICFKTKNGFSSDYFEHYFESGSLNSEVSKIAQEGGRAHGLLNVSVKEFFRDVRLMVPTLPEQQKIADCLSSIDELIEAEEQKLDELKAHKKGLMQHLFPSDGKAVPKLRFPEFHNQGEWKTKPLDQIAENLNSQRVPITKKDRIKGSIPYYGASGVIDYVKDYIFDDELLCISEDGANLVARTYPIAFSIKGKAWVNNHAHVLRFENACTQVIVESYLNSISLEDYLTGMAQPKLNRAKLNVIPIPLPDLNEQQKVADLLLSIDELIRPQIQKVNYLKFHRKGLIQNLFPSLEEVEK